MKEKVSGLDIKYSIREFSDFLNSWTGKIYEIDGIFLFKLNHPQEGNKKLIIEPGKRIHFTDLKYETPSHPPSFAMLLRKHLSNKKLAKVKQPGLERIVEIEFEGKDEKRILVAELFGEGNLILCKENQEIIKPYNRKKWKHRTIKTGKKYIEPPKRGENLESITTDGIKSSISGSPDLVRGLARNLNIGGDLAEEICARANVDKEIDPNELNQDNYERINSVINELISSTPSPIILYDNNSPVDVLPFPFKSKEKMKTKSFDTFNRALDVYFGDLLKKEKEKRQSERLSQKVEEVRNRLKNQENHLERLKNKSKDKREKGNAISTHHEKIDQMLDRLSKINKAEGWENINEKIEQAQKKGEEWAGIVESISPNEGTVGVKIEGEKIKLDFRISSFENASNFYEKSKKMKEKIEGTKEAIKETEKKLEELREEGLEKTPKTVPKKKREKEWFERYRWFISSDDILVIAGRDEKTNNEVVEKHMQSSDLYFHADIQGAPHTIIHSQGEEIPEDTIKEAARFAAMHSRSWRRGHASADVYWVRPEQVKKEAPPGEYLPKGSYMIKGERNYLTVPLEAAVGVIRRNNENVVMCGPSSAIENHSKTCISIKPGSKKKSDFAKKIKSKIEENEKEEIDLDELMRILPPGSGSFVD